VARAPLGRQQLLDSARDELTQGNGALELVAVTRRAGLSTGAVYHHFGSKIGLLEAIWEAFYEGLSQAIADDRLPDTDWATREQERTRHFVAYHFTQPLASLLLNHVAPDPGLTELEAAYIQSLGEAAAANIRRGQHSGEIAAAVDADSAGHYIIGGLRQGIAQQLRVTPRPEIDQVGERLWQLTAATLALAK